MESSAITLMTLGALLFVGLLTDLVSRRTPLPRVTSLLIVGVALGQSGLDFASDLDDRWFPLVSSMALVMVGFLLGGQLSLSNLRETGRQVLTISCTEVIGTAVIVSAGLYFLGVPIEAALLLGGVATATAPAATMDVVHESRADGPFTRTLLGIVAIDDAWGLLVFSLLLASSQFIAGSGSALDSIQQMTWEICGAIVLGCLIGIPAAFLTGRVEAGQPTLVEALGSVFLCGGLAMWLDVSFLLASMVMGATIVNFARHHQRPFHAIEGIEWPFLVLFFILAGASLELTTLGAVGLLAAAYIGLRVLGRFAGAWVGGIMSRMNARRSLLLGAALLPQAGVAMGIALIAAHSLPKFGDTILQITIGGTIVFELIGPILTRFALIRAGESDTVTEPDATLE